LKQPKIQIKNYILIMRFINDRKWYYNFNEENVWLKSIKYLTVIRLERNIWKILIILK
jgi:hypothetical protein